MSSSSSSSTAGRWIEASFEDFPPSLARVPKSVERYLYGAGEKHLLDMKIEMSRTMGVQYRLQHYLALSLRSNVCAIFSKFDVVAEGEI